MQGVQRIDAMKTSTICISYSYGIAYALVILMESAIMWHEHHLIMSTE